MKIIYHHPAPLGGLHSGSVVRPQMMRQALINQGHELFEITGERNERQKKFLELKFRIRNGEKYDYFYSESTTLPLNLRIIQIFKGFKIYFPELLDQAILKYLQKENIKGGYFLRDIHWDFSNEINDKVNVIKGAYIHFFQSIFGRMHLQFLKKNRILLFVPSLLFGNYIRKKIGWDFHVLRPGANIFCHHSRLPAEDYIGLMYVGGVAGGYDPRLFLKAVSFGSNARLVLCTRKTEWEAGTFSFQPEKVKIIHASGKELEPYYENSHIGVYTPPPFGYAKMAFSIKIAEYIGQGLPIICYRHTTVSDFVEEHQIGWTMDYDLDSIQKTISFIFDNPDDYKLKQKNVLKLQKEFTWESVVQKMLNVLDKHYLK